MATKTAFAEYVQAGENIDYTATSDVAYLQVVPLVSRIGVALEAIAKGETGTVTLTGAFRLPAATGAALSVGTKVYWDAAAGNVTATAGDIVAGIAVEDKTEAGTTVVVRIN
jgi:predicted RecA/RadA family phage recombinase